MADTLKLQCANKPLMVAHRGVSGLEKENTNAAFIAAGNRSYYGIETDVRLVKDGTYVCIHDANTERVAGDNVVAEDCSYELLRKIRLFDRDGVKGREDLCLPTMIDYIQTCKRYEKVAVLELKSNFTVENMAEMCNIIESIGWLENTVFIAFGFQNLVNLREVRPQQAAQYLISKEFDADDLCARLNEYNLDLDIYHGSLTKELLDRVHADGHKVNVWTVDTLEVAEKMAEYGVDFITSNIIE